jgi:hypothetical protein
MPAWALLPHQSVTSTIVRRRDSKLPNVEASRAVHPSFDGDLLPVLAKIRSLYPGFTAGNIEKVRALVSDGFPGMPRFDLTTRQLRRPPAQPAVNS